MAKSITLDQIVEFARQLSLVDKVRLIEEIAPQIEEELKAVQPVQGSQRIPLRGLWKGLDITEQDIAQVRDEMRGDFPREDI